VSVKHYLPGTRRIRLLLPDKVMTDDVLGFAA
jgi:hypothetical protein